MLDLDCVNACQMRLVFGRIRLFTAGSWSRFVRMDSAQRNPVL